MASTHPSLQYHPVFSTREEHHRGTTFQEEYVRLLRKGLVEYDDRHLG